MKNSTTFVICFQIWYRWITKLMYENYKWISKNLQTKKTNINKDLWVKCCTSIRLQMSKIMQINLIKFDTFLF